MFTQIVNATTTLLQSGFYGPTVVALKGFHCIFKIVVYIVLCILQLFFRFKLSFAFPLFQTISNITIPQNNGKY